MTEIEIKELSTGYLPDWVLHPRCLRQTKFPINHLIAKQKELIKALRNKKYKENEYVILHMKEELGAMVFILLNTTNNMRKVEITRKGGCAHKKLQQAMNASYPIEL